jgi:putative hydrolase of the HAD superfamily
MEVAAPPPALSGVRVVLLDAVGTVLGLKRSVVDVYHEMAARQGLATSHQSIRTRFPAAFERHFCPWQRVLPAALKNREAAWRSASFAGDWAFDAPSHAALFRDFFQLPVDETQERQLWQAVVAEVLADPVDPDNAAKVERAFQTLWDWFSRPATWSVTEDATQVITRLHRRGLRVCLASNFDRRLEKIVAGLQAELPVDHVYFSSRIGFRKPDPRFYQAILADLGVSASAVVMVGDRWWEDFAAPRVCGIPSFLYDPSNRPSESPAADPPQLLTRLADLPLQV